MNQSPEGAVQVFDEFVRGFASPDLILDANSQEARNNASLLMEYVVKKYGWVTISYLQEADRTLGARLARVPAAKQPTAEEMAEKERLKQFHDYMESIKPQPDFRERAKQAQDKAQAEKNAKAQEDAKVQLAVAISGYQAYRVNGGGIDYTATEMVQKELRGVRVGNDFVRTLAVVRQIIQELPDHPKMGDVARVVESLNARSLKSHQPRDCFGDEVREVGKLGGLR